MSLSQASVTWRVRRQAAVRESAEVMVAVWQVCMVYTGGRSGRTCRQAEQQVGSAGSKGRQGNPGMKEEAVCSGKAGRQQAVNHSHPYLQEEAETGERKGE